MIDPLNYLSEQLYQYVNFVPYDQFKLGIAFFTTIPIGFFFKRLKNPMLKNLLGAVIGLFYQFFLYQYGLISHLLQTIFVYYLAKRFKSRCGFIIFIESMLYIAAHQIYRQITDYGKQGPHPLSPAARSHCSSTSSSRILSACVFVCGSLCGSSCA